MSNEAWRDKVIEGGGQPTPGYRPLYFKSITSRTERGCSKIARSGRIHRRRPFETLGESSRFRRLRAVPRAVEQILRAASESASRSSQ